MLLDDGSQKSQRGGLEQLPPVTRVPHHLFPFTGRQAVRGLQNVRRQFEFADVVQVGGETEPLQLWRRKS